MKRHWLTGLSMIWMACVCPITNGYAQTLPPGPQVLTFFSDLDDTEQPYCIYIPPNYDAAKEYPLVVMLHGAGSNHRLAMRRVFGKSNFPGENDVEASLYFPPWKDVDMIVAAPYARGTMGYQGLAEKDVLDMMRDVKERFQIDTNRMYLTGLSMGGGGTLWIGLSHPDLWAAIAAVCPAPPEGTMALAPNALNMAVQFVHGAVDPIVPVTVSRDWVAKLKQLKTPHVEYTEVPGVDHWSWVPAYADEKIFDWFAQFRRNPFPLHVRHASRDLTHGKAYWVRMDQKTPGETARIDAAFTGTNAINILTTQLSAFSLLLNGHPMVNAEIPMQVTVDGDVIAVAVTDTITFVKGHNSGEWAAFRYSPPGPVKTAHAEGPISRAFAGRHIYVYGTADNPDDEILRARIDTALKAADWSAYRGEFLGRIKMFPRVVADKDVRQSDYEGANLILFGTTQTNSVIQSYADQLPMQLKERAAKKYGLVYLFPNAQGHLVVINSGLPWWNVNIQPDWRYLPPAQTTLEFMEDYLLFSGDLKTLLQGYFDENWNLYDNQSKILQETRALK